MPSLRAFNAKYDGILMNEINKRRRRNTSKILEDPCRRFDTFSDIIYWVLVCHYSHGRIGQKRVFSHDVFREIIFLYSMKNL